MTYQHNGKRYLPQEEECEHNRPFWECEICGNVRISKEKPPIKRYFRLDFRCNNCEKSNRLKQLKVDFMGRFKCPGCDTYGFTLHKRRVGETSVREKDTIIIIEKKTTIGRRLES